MSVAQVIPPIGGGGEALQLAGWKMEPLEVVFPEATNSSAVYIPFDPTKYAGRAVGILLMISRNYTGYTGTQYRDFYARLIRVVIKADGTVSSVESDESGGKMPFFLRLWEDLTTKNVSYSTNASSTAPYSAFYSKTDGQIVVNVSANNLGGAAWLMSAE